MKIFDVINIIRIERTLGRTMCGRPITDFAMGIVDSTLQDEKNQNQPAAKCKNCCIIMSSLLVPEGCPNCGGKDLNMNVSKIDIE